MEVEITVDTNWDYSTVDSLIIDYDQYTVWSPTKQNTVKNEITYKYNLFIDPTTGHDHDGVNSRFTYDIDELESKLRMGVLN